MQPADEPITLDDDLIIAGDNLAALAGLPDAGFDLIYMDPPFNTGRAQTRDQLEVSRTPGRRRPRLAHWLRWASLREPAAAEPQLRGRLRRLPRVPGAASASRARTARDARHALLPHRLPRGALLQAAARRDLRARRVPERADLGLRLRREAAPPLAGQARHDPGLRARARRSPLRCRRRRARAVHGARPGQRGEGGPRQAPHRRLVPHDRAHQRPREDRLPDAEARGRAATDGGGVLAARRLVSGPVCGVGHARGRLPEAGQTVRAGRLEPNGDRGHARAAGARRRRAQWRP